MGHKKHKHEEHVNHERWLISYADFITLLFAFFVVMYAVSSINEGKYRVLSNSIKSAFDGTPKTLNAIQIGDISSNFKDSEMPPQEVHTALNVPQPDEPKPPDENQDVLSLMEREIRSSMDQLRINPEDISISKDDQWIEVALKTSSLFPSGSATLSQSADRILQPIGDILKKYSNPVQVEGFTDNVPIENDFFRSNWELSALRAVAVLQRLLYFGLSSDRCSAAGYADNFPVGDNNTEEGRLQNRRVSIIVIKNNMKDRFVVNPKNKT